MLCLNCKAVLSAHSGGVASCGQHVADVVCVADVLRGGRSTRSTQYVTTAAPGYVESDEWRGARGANDRRQPSAVGRRKNKNYFSFAAVAAGPSLQYHAVGVDEGTTEFKHNCALVMDAVPAERLTDSSFWLLLFRAQARLIERNTSTRPNTLTPWAEHPMYGAHPMYGGAHV